MSVASVTSCSDPTIFVPSLTLHVNTPSHGLILSWSTDGRPSFLISLISLTPGTVHRMAHTRCRVWLVHSPSVAVFCCYCCCFRRSPTRRLHRARSSTTDIDKVKAGGKRLFVSKPLPFAIDFLVDEYPDDNWFELETGPA